MRSAIRESMVVGGIYREHIVIVLRGENILTAVASSGVSRVSTVCGVDTCVKIATPPP